MMKRLFTLLLVVAGLAWCYFWYVRGENLLDRVIGGPKPAVAPPYVAGANVHGRWESAPPMPSPRTGLGADELGGRIYVVGGFNALGKTVATVEAFDIAKGQWASVRPLPKPLHHAAVVSDGVKLYVFGGMAGIAMTPVDSLYIYDPVTRAWTDGPALPDPLGASAVAFFEGKFHLLGGQGLGQSVQSHYAYDPKEGRWSVDEPLISGRDHFAAAEIGGKLYVVGGRAGSLVYNMAATEVYDPVARAWEQRAPLSAKRSALGLSSIGGKLYAYGGEAPTLTFGDVYVYDPKADQWRIGIPMPTARQGFGYATADDKIFVIGGGRRAGFSVSDVVEVFTP